MVSLFKERLRKLRIEAGLSQYKLAQVLHVSRAAVADWETRNKEPNYTMLMQIAQFFNVTTDYLIGMVDEL